MFSETQKELQETQEKLTVTKDKLVKTKTNLRETKVTLRQTEQDRNEQKFLVSEHVRNENELFENAVSVSIASNIQLDIAYISFIYRGYQMSVGSILNLLKRVEWKYNYCVSPWQA